LIDFLGKDIVSEKSLTLTFLRFIAIPEPCPLRCVLGIAQDKLELGGSCFGLAIHSLFTCLLLKMQPVLESGFPARSVTLECGLQAIFSRCGR
jgi:hypothetical protein